MSSTGHAQFARETDDSGAFRRQQSAFRDHVSADGSTAYPAEADRYHLYVSTACPWAHRTIIVRALKGLEHVVGMTIVDPLRDERGWRFGGGTGGEGDVDPLHGWRYLSEAYLATDPAFDQRVTVPVLWDTHTNRIVNNESGDVMRMLAEQFDAFARHPEIDLRPPALRDEIDAVNAWVYDDINNGVYKCGFATTQDAYEAAFTRLFAALDRVEQRLTSQPYLIGDDITEADWRLFTTLLRFDAVYVGHFKCNLRRIVDYPLTWAYARRLRAVPGVESTINMDHIKRHYYMTHDKLNPSHIVPRGPEIDWDPEPN